MHIMIDLMLPVAPAAVLLGKIDGVFWIPASVLMGMITLTVIVEVVAAVRKKKWVRVILLLVFFACVLTLFLDYWPFDYL